MLAGLGLKPVKRVSNLEIPEELMARPLRKTLGPEWVARKPAVVLARKSKMTAELQSIDLELILRPCQPGASLNMPQDGILSVWTAPIALTFISLHPGPTPLAFHDVCCMAFLFRLNWGPTITSAGNGFAKISPAMAGHFLRQLHIFGISSRILRRDSFTGFMAPAATLSNIR